MSSGIPLNGPTPIVFARLKYRRTAVNVYVCVRMCRHHKSNIISPFIHSSIVIALERPFESLTHFRCAVLQLLDGNFTLQSPGGPGGRSESFSFGSSMSRRVIQLPDGSVEEHSSTRNSDGTERITVTK